MPTPQPTAPPTCPANCGTPERGGGTCRPNGKCLSCNENRLRLTSSGQCLQSIACRGREVQSGIARGADCRCLDLRCHYCIRSVGGDVCRRCRDNTYLLDGQCVDTCPANLASSGINSFGRRCLEPFTCQSSRIQERVETFGCKCARPNNTGIATCHRCLHRAGEIGDYCVRCNGGTYLFNNQCFPDCSMAPPSFVEYNPGNYGRECRPAFVCAQRRDPQGRDCKCPNVVGKHDCMVCEFTASGPTCNRCTNNKYLQNGRCVGACTGGRTPVGNGRDGRECRE